MARIHLSFTRDPIIPLLAPDDPGIGAVAVFDGLVRDAEDGRSIAGLVYEAYEPMAEKQLRRVVESLLESFPCEEIHVIHRLGSVRVGEAAVRVMAASAHRAEAFHFLTGFMNRLKAEVPIWKTGVLEIDGSVSLAKPIIPPSP